MGIANDCMGEVWGSEGRGGLHWSAAREVVLLYATMPVEVLEVTTKFMREPVRILVKKDELTLEGIRQFYINVEKEVRTISLTKAALEKLLGDGVD